MKLEAIIIIVILSVLLLVILGCIAFIALQVREELSKSRKLDEIFLYSEMFKDITNIYDLLDSYINERFAEYKIFNPDKFNKVMTNVQQTEVAKTLSIDVLDRMSPAFYSQLTLVFNPDNNKIHELIYNRVVMAIIADSLGFDGSEGEELINAI